MSQYARPHQDIAYINWGNSSGTPVNLFAEINEASPDDGGFIQTIIAAPVNEHYVCKLDGNAIADPGVDTGHHLKVRLRKVPAAGARLDYTIELRQGYFDELLQGDLITSRQIEDVPSDFTTVIMALEETEAALITNYNDLYVRIVANQP